ncbi:MAG: FG-GAP-like repeat-containing protein [Acidobacteriota bacterium]
MSRSPRRGPPALVSGQPCFQVALMALLLASSARAGLPSEPVEQWAGLFEGQTASEAIVVQLTDDDGDGLIDRRDVPDLVLLSFQPLALDPLTGEELVRFPTFAARDLAAADLDGDGVVEIVVADDLGVEVFEHDGTPKWSESWPEVIREWETLGIADLDQDGAPEIFRGPHVLNADGTHRWSDLDSGVGDRSVVTHAADLLPESPGLELLAGRHCYRADGTLAWVADVDIHGPTAIGDLDGDGDPEIAISSVVDGESEVVLLDHEGTRLGSLPQPRVGDTSVRPLFFFDVEGDGVSELFLTRGDAVELHDWDGSELSRRWRATTEDVSCCSGATGHDFDGDEQLEIVYQDETSWYVLDGVTGEQLFREVLESNTWIEKPIIVNVDDDPHAEIVIGTPLFLNEAVRVYEVACSTTPAGIWNQHDYHGTNVDPDGRVPAVEDAAWTAGRQWAVQQHVGGGPCGVLSGVDGLEDAWTCPGNEVVLDASGAVLADCVEELVFEWRSGDGLLGTEPVLRLTVEEGPALDVLLTVSCGDEACCQPRRVRVGSRRPYFTDPVGTVDDPSACFPGLSLSWSPVTLPADGVINYNVYRSVGPDASRDDALSRAPVVAGLTTTNWLDTDTVPRARHVYVVEAEARGVDCGEPAGPTGGAAVRLCLDAIVDDVLSGEPLAPLASCNGGSVLLDASELLVGCEERSFAWSLDGEWLGGSATLSVMPETDTTYEVLVTCDAEPDCQVMERVDVAVLEGPVLGPLAPSDLETCEAGLLLGWDPAVFPDPDVGGVYHVHRSEEPLLSCDDALSRPPVAEGLTTTTWLDATTVAGREYLYVLVAEDAVAAGDSRCPTGPSFGGLTNHACLEPIVDVRIAEPEVVWAPLRARNQEEEVTFHWLTARSLLGDESFVLLKAVDHPTEPFSPVTLDAPGARSFTETDVSSPRQFFDLRVGNCRGLSRDEYPPGP